jgi:hypothetical protein
MRDHPLKQRLYAGKAVFGVMCTFPSPPDSISNVGRIYGAVTSMENGYHHVRE